jgi:tetratricopeptide (TPR) repeat protein
VWSARASFAASDYQKAIATVGTLVANYPESEANAAGLIVQGETLIELARFDEAVLILERASLSPGCTSSDRLRSQILRADALFAMGADNSERYLAALEAYRTILLGENLTPAQRLSLSFKIGKTFERLKRMDEAIDRLYLEVVLAYRDGRKADVRYDDAAKAAFARAAFRLADEFVSRGLEVQALNVLRLVATSDVPAAAEAERRIEHMKAKGKFL